METFKVERTPQVDDFISFLQSSVFHSPILSIRQFNKGASSYNYLIETKTGKKLVKIAWKHKKSGVERLAKIIDTLSQNPHLATAHILPVQNALFFNYKKNYGFVLEYISGKSLPSYKMKSTHFQQILTHYQIFMQTNWTNPKILIPAYNFEKMSKECMTTLHKYFYKLKKRKDFRSRATLYLLKKVQNQLVCIQKTPLRMKKEKISIIHGDFHNNNLLFNKGKLVSFLDFEDVGYGYITEDLIRFILCLIERLPFFIPTAVFIQKWIKLANQRFNLTKEEWIVGLNSFTLQKIKKVLGKKESIGSFTQIKNLIRLLFFLKRYHHFYRLIQKIS